MKKIIILSVLLLVLATPLATGALNWNPIEPFSTSKGEVGENTTLSEYISIVYSASIGIAAILAVVMIVIAGVQYTTSAGKESSISNAKTRIWNAIIGLVLVLGAWLFLNTLNPAFVQNIFEIPKLDEGGTIGGVGGGGMGGDLDYYSDEDFVRQQLANGGISINKGPCPMGVSYTSVSGGCTSVGTLSSETISSLVDIKNSCECDITITGGTELGHETHGPSKGIVDLRKENGGIDDYVFVNMNSNGPIDTPDGTLYTLNDGTKFLDEEDHWHVILD